MLDSWKKKVLAAHKANKRWPGELCKERRGRRSTLPEDLTAKIRGVVEEQVSAHGGLLAEVLSICGGGCNGVTPHSTASGCESVACTDSRPVNCAGVWP
jgi:hypothetical protein